MRLFMEETKMFKLTQYQKTHMKIMTSLFIGSVIVYGVYLSYVG